MIVDAHVHISCPDTNRYPRNPTGLGTDWWKTGLDVEALTEALDANGVEKAVIVQAMALYRADCRCAADAVAEHDDRFALVAGVDMNSADPAADVAGHAAAGATGMRLWAIGSPKPTWLTDGRGADVWAAAAETGVGIVPMLGYHHFAALAALCANAATVPVAIDHAGHTQRRGEQELAHLVDVPSVHLKVTTENLEGAADSAAWFARLVEAFGADRLCWGSDYPQHPTRPYAKMRRLAEAAVTGAGLDDAQRDAFFCTTSMRLWWR